MKTHIRYFATYTKYSFKPLYKSNLPKIVIITLPIQLKITQIATKRSEFSRVKNRKLCK